MGSYIGDMQIRGLLKPDKFDPPVNCIDDEAIEANAGIDPTKVTQRVLMEHRQAHGSAVVSKRETIGVCRGALGLLKELHISLSVKSITGAKVQVMIKKNNVDMLSAALEIDDAAANYAVVTTSTFVEDEYERDDHFEAVVTPVAGGGTVGQGLHVTLIGYEDPV